MKHKTKNLTITRRNKKMGGKWSIKYKKVLIVIVQKDFLKNNIVNMVGKIIHKNIDKYNSLD